jgi:hypothetical protein
MQTGRRSTSPPRYTRPLRRAAALLARCPPLGFLFAHLFISLELASEQPISQWGAISTRLTYYVFQGRALTAALTNRGNWYSTEDRSITHTN